MDFGAFYAGRVRRLLPALLLVVAATLGIGSFVLMPIGERQGLAASGIAALAPVSNIHFWRTQSDYFAEAFEQLPLLHTWTLSVEEQFYVAWPLVLAGAVIAARRLKAPRRVVLAGVLALIGAASFAASCWAASRHPVAAFYLSPPRAWEMTAGRMLALVDARMAGIPRWIGSTLVVAGAAAIGVSVALVGGSIAYSAVAVVLPVAGAVAVMAGGAINPRTWVPRLLSSGPAVTIGWLSYSWYLWHWPLLALGRAPALGEKDSTRDWALVVAALGLAALTYRFVESPVRRNRVWPFSTTREALLTGLAGSIAGAALCGALLLQARAASQDSPWRGLYEARNRTFESPPGCGVRIGAFTQLPAAAECAIGSTGAAPRVMLWGDSHAAHFAPMVAEHRVAGHYAAVTRTMGGCPPFAVTSADLPLDPDCAAFNAAVVDELPGLAEGGLTGVIIAYRWTNLLDSGRGPDPMGDRGRAAPMAAPARVAGDPAWMAGLRASLAAAKAARLRVVVIAQVPEFYRPVPICLARRDAERCGMPRATVERQRTELTATLRQVVAEFDNARLWDPLDALCPGGVCDPRRGDVVLYSDAQHLSPGGARSLVPHVAPALAWLLP